MIFITVGTEKFPFDRLLKIIDDAVERGEITDEVFAQTGHSRYKPRQYEYKDFLIFDEQTELMKKADIIVAHAGEGSLILALSLGKVPIIFPRRGDLKEHFDNHQIDAARKINERGGVLLAHTEEELLEMIKNYKEYALRVHPYHDSDSRNKLTDYLREICG